MTKTILVLGAGGNVGRPLVKALADAGASVIAASRSGGAVEGAARSLAFAYAGKAEAEAAMAGVDAAFLMLPGGSMAVEAMLLPLVEAAAARGVKLVLLSVFGADASEDIPYRKVERAIEAAGVPHVFLRPNWFADNFHSYWKAGVAAGEIAVPAADGRSAFIDVRDIAASAASALLDSRHDGKAFALTGPAALSYGEAAAVLSAGLGRTVAYRPVDDESFVAGLTAHGVPAAYAAFIAGIFAPVRAGWTAAVTGDVRALTGREPRDLATYVRDNRARLLA